MSSQNERFECRWRGSRRLLTAYLLGQVLAVFAISQLEVGHLATALGLLTCIIHAAWVVPRAILLTHRTAFTGLRRDADGWQIWNLQGGWQSVQVCSDSVVLPKIVILRFRLQRDGQTGRWVHSICIPADALAADSHRRLRVRLKFSRRGLAAPE